MAKACPPYSFQYNIHAGDSLYRLAKRYHTSVNAITAINPGINPNFLRIGQMICIPSQAQNTYCPGQSIVVQTGETFYSIARKLALPLGALLAYNPGINPDNLRVGQTLCLVPPTPVTPDCPSNTYTIKPGDTLNNVAKQYGITLSQLLSVNPGVNPEHLYTGQIICVPETEGECPLGSTAGYIVQYGDTLANLAERFKITVADLLKANPGLAQTGLIPGRCLAMPGSMVEYHNEVYHVRLSYPAGWRQVNETRFEGDNGFFQIGGLYFNENIPVSVTACQKVIIDTPFRYGSQPTISFARNGCYIIPSNDQSPQYKNQSAFIARYDNPIQVEGKTYNFFQLLTDQAHLDPIAKTVNLI